MTERLLCRVVSAVLFFVTIGAWVAFFLLFRPGGPCYALGCDSAFLWILFLIGFTCVTCWAIWPDDTRERHN